MAWLWLALAGFFEIAWVVLLKLSEGFDRFWIGIAALLVSLPSLGFLALALKSLPVGTAYTIWVGIGEVGVVLIGVVWLRESCSFPRVFFLSLIAIGIIGLKWVEP